METLERHPFHCSRFDLCFPAKYESYRIKRDKFGLPPPLVPFPEDMEAEDSSITTDTEDTTSYTGAVKRTVKEKHLFIVVER